MKEIYHQINEERLVNGNGSITLVGGSDECHEICEDYGFRHFITVQEMSGLFPVLVPLTHKAGYPANVKMIRERV
jgi:hypothetical protein